MFDVQRSTNFGTLERMCVQSGAELRIDLSIYLILSSFFGGYQNGFYPWDLFVVFDDDTVRVCMKVEENN